MPSDALVNSWIPGRDDADASEHLMDLYDGAFPAQQVTRFLQDGRERGEAVVVVARPEHREQLQALLGAQKQGPPVFYFDADRAMARFFVDGRPDPDRFDETLGAALSEAARQGNGRVRAYGEMVALLCERGRSAAAVELEQLWNRVGQKRPLSLLCAYQRDSIAQEFMDTLCGEHGHVSGA
jgi:hypothetical protein